MPITMKLSREYRRTKNFQVGSSELALAGRLQVESGSERDIFISFPMCEDGPYRSPDSQTISLLLVMIEFARWKDVLDIVSLLNEGESLIDFALHPPIARVLGNLLEAALQPY
jgi:hypothetical protein